MFEQYIRATTTQEALQALQKAPRPVRILAGGTDLLLHEHQGEGAKFKSLIDISNVEELTGIKEQAGELWIGAATKLTAVETSTLVTEKFPVLVAGAREVGSPQIRNLATLGGNICNASPSADTVPPLLVLDARVELVSQGGSREVPLAEFFTGPGLTVIAEDEIMAAILLPPLPKTARGHYIKLKAREALDLAFVGVAVLVAPEGAGVTARIALGAVAPTPIRSLEAEKVLAEAKEIDLAVIRRAAQAACEEIAPISDVRASAQYRKEMVRNLTERALRHVLGLHGE